jgi:hypothetical protein
LNARRLGSDKPAASPPAKPEATEKGAFYRGHANRRAANSDYDAPRYVRNLQDINALYKFSI